MPQARLPDVNTAFITYRGIAIRSLQSHKYLDCLGALKSINAMLPEKYRVELNNDKFDEDSKINLHYVCGSCDKNIDGKFVIPFDYYLDSIDSLITNKVKIKVWKCPECNKLSGLSNTRIIQNMLPQPSYLQVVPLPPTRKGGLMGRTQFRHEFGVWAWNMINELEKSMAQFRDDNWSKGDDDEFGDDWINDDDEKNSSSED